MVIFFCGQHIAMTKIEGKGNSMRKNQVMGDRSQNTYVSGFYKSVIARNAKMFLKIFVGVFVVFALVFGVIPDKIKGHGDALTAQSKNIVKFAKVEETDRTNETVSGVNIGMHAAAANVRETPKMNKIEDTLTTIDLSDESGASGTLEPRMVEMQSQDKKDTSATIGEDRPLEEFHIYTICSANVRGEPVKTDNIIVAKARGERFTVVGENGDWYKIKWGDDGYAYISKSCVSDVEP